MSDTHVPAGFQRLPGQPRAVFVRGNQVVVLGVPGDESEDGPLHHNCDAMGCGHDHVLLRAVPTSEVPE